MLAYFEAEDAAGSLQRHAATFSTPAGAADKLGADMARSLTV